MNNVELAQRIGVSVIQSRGEHAVTHGQQAPRQLDRSRSRVEMAEVALQGRDGNFFRSHPQGVVIGPRLGPVISLRGFAVRVNVTEFARVDLCLPQSRLNGPHQSHTLAAIRSGCPIATRPDSHNFCVNRGSPTNRMFVTFQDESPSPFTNHGTVPESIEGTAGSVGVFSPAEGFIQMLTGQLDR